MSADELMRNLAPALLGLVVAIGVQVYARWQVRQARRNGPSGSGKQAAAPGPAE
jgi:hypothetical protein